MPTLTNGKLKKQHSKKNERDVHETRTDQSSIKVNFYRLSEMEYKCCIPGCHSGCAPIGSRAKTVPSASAPSGTPSLNATEGLSTAAAAGTTSSAAVMPSGPTVVNR